MMEGMKILLAGATGVLGRATLPHLRGHDVVGTTRDAAKRGALEALGARAEVCDVYEAGAFARVAAAFRPDVVVNFLTDLAGGPGPANGRIRAVGAPIVSAAARASGARRLVVESIAFETAPASAAAVVALEADALGSGLEAIVLRFGRFWGPGTWSATPPEPPGVHVDEAGRRAARHVLAGAAGTFAVVDGTMNIRAFAPADFAAARALWVATEGVGLSPGDEAPEIAAFLARNPGLSLVAFEKDDEGERLVGAMLCGHDGRRGYFYHLAVAPSHRRRGLARQLVERALAGLRAAGVRRAQASVFATNTLAHGFWSAVGGRLRRDLVVFSIPLE